MLTRRIIPCLDVKDGQVVKGVKFVNLVNEGNPVELAARYSDSGADELVFLDITATLESRRHVVDLLREVAKRVFIPFTVGGGIRTTDDIGEILHAGADKVSINSAALKNPGLLTEGARRFGSQCIVLAMDVKRNASGWRVHSHGGTKPTKREAIQWAMEAVEKSAGEILLTSMDADGTQNGVDVELTRRISRSVNIPVIASGGIGTVDHFREAIETGEADAVLAASVFHRGIFTVREVKESLAAHKIPMRLTGEENEL
ncbi:MAG: imidazole glycerol phosphate synthase subunit HisF [Candidatus Marinimicrobia bacterium]|nr:imidazole glycerol phosphate synthase subunit HisF [Candidatus Neomarinimicrobiota bacterium]MDP6455915.1 imidazole glycerol phosphate synthase subunit HisF [Candidatus Neomarinimicrobiota bacterium]MDP6592979.1 imidazole glycerol phosphate synthase subunit HisF [Candidatus Neomarinimicrobiota bacterium]MDP6835935.1 imidazole glycerol phosphate synthase subunit HisF [Candidatus Neomarinimicrobiota bacterium]MDP6965980.1 imidazole glycerol phosphate synthase subunit HisF [Candidatus Neomarini